MKVKELVEQLKNFPEDFEVVIRGNPVTQHYTPLRDDHLTKGNIQMFNGGQGYVSFEGSPLWKKDNAVIVYKWDGF